jgi:hypothetical protein
MNKKAIDAMLNARLHVPLGMVGATHHQLLFITHHAL